MESAAAEEADVGGQSKKGRKGDGKKEKTRARKDAARPRPRTKTLTGDAEEVWNPFAHLEDA